jgi:phytanoyl-CoA hydroxylase
MMAGLSRLQLKQFRQEGYLKLDGLLDPVKDLDPIRGEYTGVLDSLARNLYEAGKIPSTYSDLPFGERVIRIYADTGEVHAQYFDFALPQGNVKHDTPMWVGPAVFRAITNPRLLDNVQSIIGGEIYSNPVQHVRIKPPEQYVAKDEFGRAKLGATSWHQDNGVVLPVADESNILTVWFSLTDATEEQGCLQLVPGSHKEGLLTHCPGGPGGIEIPEHVLDRVRAIPVPTKRGDVLFLNKRTCHSSLSNVSNEIRWSFDLRYNPIGQDTGREAFPGFVARSLLDPASELKDPESWAHLWYETRKRMADAQIKGPFNRWKADAPGCA